MENEDLKISSLNSEMLQYKIIGYLKILKSERVKAMFKANNVNLGILEEFIYSYKKHFDIKEETNGKANI